MQAQKHLFTSESVTEGHPDKICDQISDAILDAVLADDPEGRVACECAVTTGLTLIMGEITTSTYVDFPSLARQVIKDIGYTDAQLGFDGNTCAVISSIDAQSADIAMGVDVALELREKQAERAAAEEAKLQTGAGDQGIVFGCAVNETDCLMPAPIHYAHKLAQQLAAVRKNGEIDYLGPDGKTQITMEYDGEKPVRIDTVVLSTQHRAHASQQQIYADVVEKVIRPVLPAALMEDSRILVNPTGRFVVGGPHGDSGLTGRKIIVDSYGGYGRHGGGAFSGKDPTKMDRSAAYAARYVAKNIVAAGLARRCEIEVAYAIGVARPVSVWVDTQGTGSLPDIRLAEMVQQVFDLRPAAIIERFGLKRPIYRQTASYGHFGRTDLDLPWEGLDLVAALNQRA